MKQIRAERDAQLTDRRLLEPVCLCARVSLCSNCVHREREMEMSAREARRRRILDRGSHRLALITGQIQTLPSSSSEPHHSNTASSQDRDLTAHTSDQSNVALHGEEDILGTVLSNESAGSAAIVDPQSRKSETNHSTIKTPALDTSSEVQPSSSASAIPNSSDYSLDSEQRRHVDPKVHRSRLFTANKISSSISASENIRVLCSVIIALLVVLSHLRLPLLGSNIIKSILVSRPLYLLLLTDISIVLAPLFLKQVGCLNPEEDGARKAPVKGGNYQAEAVGKALEGALVLYKVLCAAFMDCSIYAVVVICGFSLAQLWL